jgi:hypothetical protein
MRLRSGAPILIREPGHTQVGLARPLAFSGLTADEAAFLASLEGRRVALSRTERERFGPIVAALEAHGLLEAAHPRPGRTVLVRLHGVDPITTALGIGLALGGVSALSIIDRRSARWSPGGHLGMGFSDATSLTRFVKDANPIVRIAGPDERASLEVLRAHGASDIGHARDLTARDIPHLDIVSDEEGVNVGPLIAPGLTPCETCLGIARTERDPWWPRLALQLGDPRRDGGLRMPPEAVLLTAGIALREILGFLRGGAPLSRRWRIPFEGEALDVEDCVAHPACGCGAAHPESDPASTSIVAPTYP